MLNITEAAMKIYMNFAADAGVDAYDYGQGWFRVQFKDGAVYEYTQDSVGEQVIKGMRDRALLGKGLKAYIDAHASVLHGRQLR